MSAVSFCSPSGVAPFVSHEPISMPSLSGTDLAHKVSSSGWKKFSKKFKMPKVSTVRVGFEFTIWCFLSDFCRLSRRVRRRRTNRESDGPEG